MQPPDPLPSIIRQKVLEALHARGADENTCSETVLLNDGYFVGRRFRNGGLEAVWLAGEQTIRIFNEAGELIATPSLDAAEVTTAKAA